MNTRKRILICDDSLTIRKLLEMVLVPAGFDVVTATNGQEAIATAKREPPDLLLLDFILPDMKGRDVCDALAAAPRTALIPVLVVSGKGDELQQVFRNARSVVGFVHKPFQGDAVLEQVRRALAAATGTPAATAEPATATRPTAANAAPTAARPTPAPAAPARTEHERKEAVARAIFGVLREQFARIPDLLPQLGEQPAAMFFAKKFLTPAVIDALVQAVQQGSPPPPAANVNAGANAGLADLASLAQDATLLLAEACPTRGAGFSARLAQTELPGPARAVLALVDGRHTFAQVVERSNLPPAEVLRIVATQARSGLIQMQRPVAAAGARSDLTQVVALVSNDVDGLQRPLSQHLSQRARPYDTIAVGAGTPAEVAERLATRRPALILIDAENPPTDVEQLARELQQRRELRDTKIGVITADLATVPAAGTGTATLHRPIRLQDIEALLTS